LVLVYGVSLVLFEYFVIKTLKPDICITAFISFIYSDLLDVKTKFQILWDLLEATPSYMSSQP